MNKIQLRGAFQEDSPYLKAIDNKCFYHPYSMEQWKEFADNKLCSISILTAEGSPVGFCITTPIKGSTDLFLNKLAISPVYQGKDWGKLLIQHVIDYAGKKGSSKIVCILPESMCNPDEKVNAQTWLSLYGFEGVGIKAKFVVEHGEFIDGFVFERKV